MRQWAEENTEIDAQVQHIVQHLAHHTQTAPESIELDLLDLAGGFHVLDSQNYVFVSMVVTQANVEGTHAPCSEVL